MIKARPRSWFSATWELFEDDRKVAEFSHGWWNETAKLVVDGQLYQIERRSWRAPWRLLAGPDVVLEARKPSAWKTRFEIAVGKDALEIVPEGWTNKSWLVTNRDGTILGRIGRDSWWQRRAWVDLPAGMPVTVQAFLLCLAVFMWNRQTMAAGGGAAASGG